jgi:hypothetical protein
MAIRHKDFRLKNNSPATRPRSDICSKVVCPEHELIQLNFLQKCVRCLAVTRTDPSPLKKAGNGHKAYIKANKHFLIKRYTNRMDWVLSRKNQKIIELVHFFS